MNTERIRNLAEENLEFVLERARLNEGRIVPEDAVAAQLFCRVVEAESSGGPYGITTYITRENRDGVLAAASRAVGVREGNGS